MTKKTDPTKSDADVTVVGVDDGFAMTKLVIMNGTKVSRTMMIPSRARAGIHGTTVIGHDEEAGPAPAYETDGVQFTVGALADAESARFNEYPFSGMNRVIVHHALRMAGLGGKKVRIATGLPLSTYYKGSEPNADVIARKNASIVTPVRAMDDSEVAIVADHKVFPEGLAVWVDYAIGEDGAVRADLTETVGIIDIGGRTTDVAVVLPGKRIDHARCGSADIGALNVIEEVGVALLRSKGVNVPAAAIEQALRTKTLKMWGKPTDVTEIVNAAAAQVLDGVLREVNRRLGDAVDVDRILLAGGGAYLFADVAKRYPNVVVVDQPEFANARGFAKYLSM